MDYDMTLQKIWSSVNGYVCSKGLTQHKHPKHRHLFDFLADDIVRNRKMMTAQFKEKTIKVKLFLDMLCEDSSLKWNMKRLDTKGHGKWIH